MGRFRVREITLNGSQVQSLAVDFVQHDGKNGGPALFGNLRPNSAIAETTPFIEPVYTASGQLQFSAQQGGIGYQAPGHSATIPLTHLNTRTQLQYGYATEFRYSGPLPGVTGDSFWSLDFSAPGNVPPQVGTYANATRWPFQAATAPGLDFSYDGSGNDTLTGNFNVTVAQYDKYEGFPVNFTAGFTQYSNGNTAQGTFGSVTYQTSNFRNGALIAAPILFVSSFEDVETTPMIQSLAYPCAMP